MELKLHEIEEGQSRVEAEVPAKSVGIQAQDVELEGPIRVALSLDRRGLSRADRIRGAGSRTSTKGMWIDGRTQETTLEHPRQEAPHALEARDAIPVALPALQPAEASAPRVRSLRLLRGRRGDLAGGAEELVGAEAGAR